MAGRLVRGICAAAAAASLVTTGGTAVALPGRAPTAPGPATGSEESAAAAGRSPAASHGPARHVPARHSRAPQASAPHGAVRPAAGAPGAAGQLPVLLADLRRLYGRVETASTAYRATRRALRRERAAAARVDRRRAAVRRALDRSRLDAGRIARLQYQGTSTALSPYVRLLLAPDPQHALEQGHMLQRVSAARAAAVRRLTADRRHADRLAAAAHRSLDRRRDLLARQRRDRDTVQSRLKSVERRLAALGGTEHTSEDRAAPAAAPTGTPAAPPTGAAPAASPADAAGHRAPGRGSALLTKALRSSRPPSKDGAEALRYAVAQIGKPYVWGGDGPGGFDCSGLTQQAWAHAGRDIPRTSQEQWARLTRIPMDRLRPGDLVVYFPGATHVALYAGGGMVVQAPRPGQRIKVSPVDSNPVLGAVRPDPGERSP